MLFGSPLRQRWFSPEPSESTRRLKLANVFQLLLRQLDCDAERQRINLPALASSFLRGKALGFKTKIVVLIECADSDAASIRLLHAAGRQKHGCRSQHRRLPAWCRSAVVMHAGWPRPCGLFSDAQCPCFIFQNSTKMSVFYIPMCVGGQVKCTGPVTKLPKLSVTFNILNNQRGYSPLPPRK